jgi:hypothetical protein
MGRFALGFGRFVVRGWVSIVMVGYAVLFAILLIALSAKSDDDNRAGDVVGMIFRILAEALFWTFHPFSPVYLGGSPPWARSTRRRSSKVPFYERVNRFVFGPPPTVRDPLADERRILAEFRRQKGRVGPADVMRVTGLSREEADRVLLRLLVDYDGEIEVSGSGAIVYRFPSLRTTAQEVEHNEAPAPVWGSRAPLQPLTGNSTGSNLLFILINTFNMAASGWALANDLTIQRVGDLLLRMSEKDPTPLPPVDGLPWALGVIPFFFSAALFLLPLARLLRRPKERRRVARENGWRGLLRQILSPRRDRIEFTHPELAKAWESAAGTPPSTSEVEAAVRSAGGEVEIREDGQIVYRFKLLADERAATESERQQASPSEASPGEVVFSSADEGSGIREDTQEGFAQPPRRLR